MNILVNIYNSSTLEQRKLIFIYTISLIALCIFVLGKKINSNLFTIMDKCFIGTPGYLESYVRAGRGSNYYLNNSFSNIPSKCLVTGWALSHVILYMVLGYVLPNMFWETLFIGILWEIVECIFYKCHDIMDVLWNSIGFIIGMILYKLFKEDSVQIQ